MPYTSSPTMDTLKKRRKSNNTNKTDRTDRTDKTDRTDRTDRTAKLGTNDKMSNSLMLSSQDPTDDALKLVIVCVGLPARGKSYITKKLQRYLNWMQYNTKIFNVGNTRRQLNVFIPSNYPVQGPTVDHSTPKAMTPSTSVKKKEENQNEKNEENEENEENDNIESHDANLFDHSNKENFQRREQWAKETLDHLLDYLLSDDGNVGIFDATNTTKARRKWIVETINKRTKGLVKILFLESICTDEELIEKNIHLKLSGPDYKKMDPQKALQDFKQRLINYEKVYETIDEDEEVENGKFDIQYVKIINAGKKVISYNISGYLSSQCVFFLLNFNLTDRQIWLTANGESVFNVQNRLGGDSDLTKQGIAFAKALPKFIAKKRQEFKLKQYGKEFINDTTTFKTNNATGTSNKLRNFNIWTSTLKRSIETAHYFPRDEFYFKSFKILNDLGCGSFDSITEDDFRYLHPDEYLESLENKLSYRYPGLGGESYLDVISRLRPIIIELERLKDHVLIVSHRVIIRVLLCYFMNLNKEMLTELEVLHNYVYCIEPKPYGLDLNIWHYDSVTDMFIEVDVAEIMKRKRKRGSLVMNDVERLRRLLLRHSAYDSDDVLSGSAMDEDITTEDDDDDEDESESDDLITTESDSGKSSPKVLCGRTESQAYEFSKNSRSSSDLKLFGFNPVNTVGNNNIRLNGSTSFTSLASMNSLPSGTSLSSLPGVSQLKRHLKGSSSDLRGQAQVAAAVASNSTNLQIPQIPTNGGDTVNALPAISMSRKNSLKHIKKPSIDWDLFDNHTIEDNPVDRKLKLHKVETNSSGTNSYFDHNKSPTSPTLNILDTEVDLIMSNPVLVEKIMERLKQR